MGSKAELLQPIRLNRAAQAPVKQAQRIKLEPRGFKPPVKLACLGRCRLLCPELPSQLLGTRNGFRELREPFGAPSGNLIHVFPRKSGTLSARIRYISKCFKRGEGIVHSGAETV